MLVGRVALVIKEGAHGELVVPLARLDVLEREDCEFKDLFNKRCPIKLGEGGLPAAKSGVGLRSFEASAPFASLF